MNIQTRTNLPKLPAPSTSAGRASQSLCSGCAKAPCACGAEPSESVSLSAQQAPPEKPETPGAGGQQPPEQGKVQVAVYGQDPYVGGPIYMEIDQADIGANMTSDRVVTRDNRELAKPDAAGNYLLAEDSDGISQVNAHVFTQQALDMAEEYRGADIPWATGRDQMSVTPHKREGRNAYYSRWGGGTNFFFSHSPGLNTIMKTANSTDVVVHETGHATLDGMRPGFFGTHDRETGAFHEAYGDSLSMLYALKLAPNRDKILAQTLGDMQEHNIVSSLAEEFGAARAFDNNDPADDHKIWLRTALNKFTYQDPNTLDPGRGDDDNLGGEVHSFGRLWAGGFYSAIESVYNQSVADGMSPDAALANAGEVTGPLLHRAIDAGSTSRARFKEIALGMLSSDQALNEGKYSEGLKQVFLDRKFITQDDINADEARRAAIPSLQLPEGLSKANAVNFLEANAEKLGLPQDLPYAPDSVTKNDKGETFVSFRYAQEVPVTVAGLENLVTDVHGGVNLVFDASGNLVDSRHDAITAETIENEMKGIADSQANNAVVEQDTLNLFKSDVDTSVFKSAIQGNKLVRIPVSSCNHHHH